MDEITLFKEQVNVLAAQKVCEQLPQVECEVRHNFSPGIYVREVLLPKGTIAIGKRHRHESCNMLLKGEVYIYMGQDQPAKKITAPCIFNSMPFVKKMVYASEESIFANVHPTDLTDLEEIEKEFIITEEEFDKMIDHKGGQKCLGS